MQPAQPLSPHHPLPDQRRSSASSAYGGSPVDPGDNAGDAGPAGEAGLGIHAAAMPKPGEPRPPAAADHPAEREGPDTPLEQRKAQVDPEVVRQRMRAAGGLHRAPRRRLDLTVWGRFNPAKDRDKTIREGLSHLNRWATRPRVAREVGGQVRSRMGDDVERLMREPHGASGGAQAAATAAPGAPAPARYDNDMLMYVGFKIAGRYDNRDGVPPDEVAQTFLALAENAMQDPQMDARALRFLTAGFFPGLTRESARMTAVVFFDKYGTASDNPKVRAIAEGISATMSDPIRKGVRTLLAMNESANRGAAGDTPASAQRALALFDQVKDYRIDRDGFWKDRLQTTLREIDGLIFDPHEHSQGLRARWQWPGPASKNAAKDKGASGNPSPAKGSTGHAARDTLHPPEGLRPTSPAPGVWNTDDPFDDTDVDPQRPRYHVVPADQLPVDDPSDGQDERDEEIEGGPPGASPAEGAPEGPEPMILGPEAGNEGAQAPEADDQQN